MARNPADVFRATCVLLLLCAGYATAAPRSIDDCEPIKQADAYNQCLATFGPAAHIGGRTSTPPPGADKSDAAAPTERAPRARRHGRAIPPWLAARQAEGRARRDQRRHRAGGVTVIGNGAGRVRTIIDIRK